MYFRIDSTQMQHTRLEYDFSDLIGEVGGTVELLTKAAAFVLGGYLSFHSSIEIMNEMYSCAHDIREV